MTFATETGTVRGRLPVRSFSTGSFTLFYTALKDTRLFKINDTQQGFRGGRRDAGNPSVPCPLTSEFALRTSARTTSCFWYPF